MEVITLREYARRVGVSLTAVQKGEQSGRIEVIRNPQTGRITGIDWDTQGPAWTANSKHQNKRPQNIRGGRPRHDGQPSAPAIDRQAGEGGEDGPRAPVGTVGGATTGGMTLAEIQRARELVKLQIDNEKLKETRGETVPAAEQVKQGRKLASVVISGMYNIPDRISDELAGMSEPHEIHALLLQEIDRAVSDLRKAYA